MKKSLSLLLLMSFFIMAYTQNIPASESSSDKVMEIVKHVKIGGPVLNLGQMVNNSQGNVKLLLDESQIGTTWYDLQTNSQLDNRFYRYDDGSMGAVWTMGFESSNFPDRGTGYNFYNGVEWGPEPMVRIESLRCGWPSYSPWGADGELVVSHDFAASELIINTRETKGSGSWNESVFTYTNGPATLSWARVITSGENNEVIHLISNTYGAYMGQPTGLVYSRSTDGGDTWDPENMVLEGTGDDSYFEISADDYTMAARGNTVGILIGSPWMDLFYMRSDDSGDNWSKHIVWEHPYPFLDPATMLADTFFCMDGSAQLTIDYQGHAHVVFGIQRAIADESGYGLYAWNPDYDGIGYWNDMMEPFSNDLDALAPPDLGYENTEMIEDVNYIGWMQDVDGDGVVTLEGIMNYRTPGMSSMPTITVDEQGQRFVIFTSNTETYVYTGGIEPVNYKHLWARAYANTVWGEFIDLNEDISHVFDECIYPQLASSSDDNIHYFYNADVAPGTALDGDHDYQVNRMIYGMFPKSDLITGIDESHHIPEANVSQNYPNPFSNETFVKVELENAVNLRLVVTNLAGQKVLEYTKGQVVAGEYGFKIDGSSLNSGIYFYTVYADDSSVTRKMVVK